MKSDLLKIINNYGVRHQLKKLNEEVFELIEAIRDYEEQKQACENIGCSRIHTDKCKEHIEEEFADVMVMLGQFQHYYNIDEKNVRRIMSEKADRQIERIINENNNI